MNFCEKFVVNVMSPSMRNRSHIAGGSLVDGVADTDVAVVDVAAPDLLTLVLGVDVNLGLLQDLRYHTATTWGREKMTCKTISIVQLQGLRDGVLLSRVGYLHSILYWIVL